MRSWDLSTVEVDVLVDVLRLPALPYPLDLPSPGVTYDERDHHIETVLADLATRDLVEERDVTDGLAAALGLLATGEIVIDGRLTLDRQIDLVAVLRGDRAAVATQTGDVVRISSADVRSVTPMIVDLLPPVPKLPGQPISVPYNDFSRALELYTRTGHSEEFEQILADAGVGDHDRRTLSGLARSEAVGAQFGVARRDAGTDEYHDRRVWTWYSTSSGSAVLTQDFLAAPRWTTLTPADGEWLSKQLTDAVYVLRYRDS